MTALDEHEVQTGKYIQKTKEELENFLSYRVGEAAGSLSIFMYCEALITVLSFNMPSKEFQQYRNSKQKALVELKEYTYDLIKRKNFKTMEVVS